MIHDADTVGHRQRFALIVGNVQRGNADCLLNILDPHLHLFTHLFIQCAQGFVQQQDLRLDDQYPRQRHPLALTA